MSVFITLLAITGALMLDAPFDVNKVAFHGTADKEGKTYKCEPVTEENRSDIINHVTFMMKNNSLNGEELMHEEQDVYRYVYFARNIGGQIFTLTKKDCEKGLIELGQIPSGTVHGG